MRHKILFFISILLLSNVFGAVVLAQQSLEVLYPEIFGTAPGPGTGLPDYITYIFKLSIVVIGLIIFGVLVYNGVQYLLSAGNAAKLSEAKSGILYGFLGMVILLSAWLILTTLNPQLSILTPPPLGEVAGMIPSGVYICNHTVSNIESILNKYLNANEKERKDAVNEFLKTIYKSRSEYCRKATAGKSTISKIETMFVVPERAGYDITTEKYSWKYTSAIIIKEANKTLGTTECFLFPTPLNNKIYRHQALQGHEIVLSYMAIPQPDEIFLIRKLDAPPPDDSQGVILYEGAARNTMGKLGKAETVDLKKMAYKPEGEAEVKEVSKADLISAKLHKNTKSIEVDPPGKHIAVLQGRATLGGKMCDVIDSVENNLGTRPIGKCGARCFLMSVVGKSSERVLEEYCYSCFDQMTVIKGSIVR